MAKINMKDLEQIDRQLPERVARRHAPKSELESSVVKGTAQAAKAMGWYVERRNTGAASNGDSFVRYGTPGGADLIVVVNVHGLPVHIEAEAKRPSGGRQSPKQVVFEKMCKCMEIPYFMFTSTSEFIDNVKKIIESMEKKIESVGIYQL